MLPRLTLVGKLRIADTLQRVETAVKSVEGLLKTELQAIAEAWIAKDWIST